MTRQITSVIGGSTVVGDGAHGDVNPSDLSDNVLEYGSVDASVASDAITAATDAFPVWSRTTPWQRSEVLDKAGTEVLARADELGDLLAREEGKTLPEARGEVVRAGQILKYFAGAVLAPHGHVLDSVRPGVEVSVTREPIGVVSVITPWNFPIAIPAWKIAPALAFGNTVVFKPAELVPGSAWELVDILNRSGLPAGALNLVLGRGSLLGPTLTTDPGSTASRSPDPSRPGAPSSMRQRRSVARCNLSLVARTLSSSLMTPTSTSRSTVLCRVGSAQQASAAQRHRSRSSPTPSTTASSVPCARGSIDGLRVTPALLASTWVQSSTQHSSPRT